VTIIQQSLLNVHFVLFCKIYKQAQLNILKREQCTGRTHAYTKRSPRMLNSLRLQSPVGTSAKITKLAKIAKIAKIGKVSAIAKITRIAKATKI